MNPLPIDTRCPVFRACAWSQHRRKHFPFKGMRREHTVREPARYRSGLTAADIRALESLTVAEGERQERSQTKSEYYREAEVVIGWDCGEDATISFAECSGGLDASRTFHGRPMSEANRRAPRP